MLRAPRGFGKSSTVAYWLRSGQLDDRSAAWLTLSRPTTQTDLWRAMHDALVAAGLAAADESPGRASVDGALRTLTRRLVIVIDGLHHLEPAVDTELVELTQAHDLLHLVVISRVERPIVSIGPATVDAAVLGVPELLMTTVGAGLLASRLGLDVTEEEVSRVVGEYAGWPALVRAALLDSRRAADGRLVTDPAGVSRYVALILADAEHEQWWDVVTALAVPERLRPDDLGVLLDRPEQRSAAEVVLAESFTMVRSNGTAGYPAGMRQALLENFVAKHAERYRELNERLSRRRREQREPAEALTYALRAKAWPLVLTILEENWAELLRRHAAQVNAAVRALPAEMVAASPRLIVARDYVLDSGAASQAEAALREGLLRPGGRILVSSLTTTQRLALRFDGTPTYGAPEILLGGLDGTPGGAVPRRPAEVERAVPELLTQWGLSMLYDNDGVGAAYGFALACQEAMRRDDEVAAREAASGTALAMALLGHTQAADAWIQYASRCAAAPSALEAVARPLTDTMLAALRLDDVTWPEVAPASVEHGLRPLLLLSQVAAGFADILHGRLEHARIKLQRHAADHDDEQEEVVRASVAALQVDLALAEGRIDRAGALLAATDAGGAWTLATRARHAFYVGAYAEAIRLTEDAASFAGARPRVGLELLLILACASWRAGHHDVAVDQLATAVGIAADTELRSPFLTVPRADLEAIAQQGSLARVFLDRPPLAGTDTVFPEPLQAGQLSAAELRVLRELRKGSPLAHIGRRLYLSESTVKTHVRRIYRKLGVSDRTHALERARELSLFDES
ncbi:LuxR C-terminal-related transcriptional regulator [Georgenia sp. H159]|uniref:LuxR C-terminal-related transcriptional regulator n=1 Tax=Georgenia sp. H159 TaxID=3076115 RepID=UPI002D7A1486|nr:LuxR C-terminal-related transcriptional regulator [Georgenia sp. H159]